MYETHWNLSVKPFDDDRRLEHFYCSQEIREAVARMLYAAAEGKNMILLGGPGTGKSYLLSGVVRGLKARDVQVAHVGSPAGDRTELLRQVALALGLRNPPEGRAEVFDRLEKHIRGRARRAPKGAARVVVAVDDADAIDDDGAYEELRVISTLESPDGTPLTSLILTGRSTLLERLKSVPGLLQMAAITYDLPTLTEDESASYIRHRHDTSGGNPGIYEDDALKEMYRFAKGNARLLNHICDLSLLIACSEDQDEIDRSVVQAAKGELKGLK